MAHDIDARTGEPEGRPMPANREQEKADRSVPLEVAESEFERFCDAMDLEVDTAALDEESREAFEREKRTILRAVQKRRLEFDAETAEPLFYPENTPGVDSIRFREPTGASFQAMDSKKRNQDMTRLYALMADITGQTPKTFAKMPNRDLKVCRALILVFMG